MKRCKQQLISIGRHDFTSFRSAHCQAPSPIRTLEAFEISHTPARTGGYIIGRVVSRAFLHNQVRVMMGTLKLVGEGRLAVDDIPKLLANRDRRTTGPTAPPPRPFLKEHYILGKLLKFLHKTALLILKSLLNVNS